MSKLYRETNRGARKAVAETGDWLMGVPAIVADNDDPERQHRVRVIIPSIDEDLVFDEWARQMVFCLGNGYGSAFIPPKDSEVVLFGQLGQKFNLFYASLYNEEMMMPEGFDDEMTVGVSAPGNLKLIAQLLARIEANNIEAFAAQNIEIKAQNLAELIGNATTVQAIGNNLLKGNSVQVEGATIQISSNGSISISGGNITISGDSVKIHNRTVNKSGGAI